jgi:hypothetical protein
MTSETTEQEIANRKRLHKVSGYGILISKILFVLFTLFFFSFLTWTYIITPYSKSLIGVEFSFALILIFRLIRYYTYIKDQPSNTYLVQPKEDELKLLIQDLDWDIKKYEQSSMYYFSQVRSFKHLTILLAGISTIVLGLQLDRLHIPLFNLDLDYKTFSKNTALVIGAIVTALTSYMTYWNLEKYWFTNKTIVNELRAVRDRTSMLCARGNPTADEIKELFKAYQAGKEKFLKYWEGALSERGSSQGAK